MKWFLLLLLFYQMGYTQQTINDYNTMEPIVTKDFEKFDKKYYDELKIKYNDVSFTIYLKDNSYLELTDSSYRLTVPNSYFTLTKGYYKNGNIKIKGSALNNNSQCKIGTWYEFGEDGKLIKETNYNAPYKFTFEQILQFCEKEKIPLTKGPITGGIHTEIARGMDNALKKNVWYVSWFKQSDLIETFVLDAETGKVIDKKYSEYINN
ncbi:hypothetical protein BWK63_13525 [Flavobacterium covae]|uniref:PepSY domain-containing protein n=1 Tax=Flavobacterium covae TaxID=2906076 RepID=A0ABW8PKK6_9FLAO|nr:MULTISPECIES: hypothetical protein [Flavobacterium]OWP79964.1 hypothetical protein BWK63_13525 [Flavobacterium covae]POR17766.1 hypothetical protein BWK57_14055 [Flavobacterium columnare]